MTKVMTEEKFMEIVDACTSKTYETYIEIIDQFDEELGGFHPQVLHGLCISICYNFCHSLIDDTIAALNTAGISMSHLKMLTDMLKIFEVLIEEEQSNFHDGNKTIN